MGTGYQPYLNTIENIESANFSREETSSETDIIIAIMAREDTSLERCGNIRVYSQEMAPWSSGAGYL